MKFIRKHRKFSLGILIFLTVFLKKNQESEEF